MSTASFAEQLTRTFTPEPFRQLARQTRWLQRQGKIDAFEFFTGLAFGQLSAGRQTLSAHAQGFGEPVSRQAVDQRFTPAAVAYFQAVFGHLLAHTLAASAAPDPKAEWAQWAAGFSAVYLLDSTSFDCPASLTELFPACGGAGSPANLKVLLRYEWQKGQLEPLLALPGKRSDQGLACATAERLTAGQLQIQDKGFYAAKAWHAAEQRGAYLLQPLPHSLTLWLTAAPTAQTTPLDLAAILKASPENCLAWPQLWLGTPRHRTGALRLVAFRLSPESAARHRQGLREASRRQGRTPTATALELAGWLLLLTNAPAHKLPTALLSYVYRLRWQIELIFRQLKTSLRLDQTESENPCRVQCELWARLSVAVVVFHWHAQTNAECWRRYQCPASFEKVIRIVQQWGQALGQALLAAPAEGLVFARQLWQTLLRHGRKGRQKSRPTTLENLCEHWLIHTKAKA